MGIAATTTAFLDRINEISRIFPCFILFIL